MSSHSILSQAGIGYRAGLAVLVLAGALCVYLGVAATESTTAAACRLLGPVAPLAEVREASGLAMSRRMPGAVWTHNDSGAAVLFMLDQSGVITGRLRLSGVSLVDWEAIAVGPCPAGSCLYVGDIGDNNASRDHIAVYRTAEPSGGDNQAVNVEAFRAKYPDGPQDAETLLVTPGGDMYIVTKGSTGPVMLYRFPHELRANQMVQLERIGSPRSSGRVTDSDEITDGSVSADGSRTVLRTHGTLLFYRTTQLLGGYWQPDRIIDLRQVSEAQGEGVTFGDGDSMYLASEGGGGSRPGTFARVECAAAAETG